MEKFIQDYTKSRLVRVSHISTVQVIPLDCERRGNIVFRLYAVEVTLKNKTKHILKKGFKDFNEAKDWMKGLGFLKEKNKKEV